MANRFPFHNQPASMTICHKQFIAISCSAVLALFVSLTAGCGKTGPKLVQVNGKVTMQGRPLTCGVVTFQPLEDGKVSTRRPSIGVIEESGTYRISTFANHDGAMPGEYLVSVDGAVEKASGKALSIDPVEAAPIAGAVPKKYLTPQTSGLKAMVPDDTDAVTVDFTLDGA
jgi:hypothetical protein